MISKYKIGLGLVTCDRENYLSQSLQTVIDNSRDLDYFILVNDGEKLSEDSKNLFNSFQSISKKDLIQHFPKHQSVGKAKNQIIKKCLENDCDFVYIMEDDMLLQNSDVFLAYLKGMNASGIFHMNFSKHGNANKKESGEQNPRMVVDYENGVKIGLYPNLVGSFNIYHKNVLKAIGNYDETFKNAFEHVEHTYNVISNNLHPPFWWFADLYDSEDYVREIEGSIQNSTRTEQAKENERHGFDYFKKKHGIYVNQIPNLPKEKVFEYLKFLETNYSNKLEI